MVTLIFSLHGVWRHGEDVARNFCLSFFVEEDAMDMSEIALEDDIYLYFWLYYMKPIFVVGETFGKFKMQNLKSKMEDEAFQIPLQKEKISLFEPVAKILDIFIRPL
jgi:hypothetical protein